MDTRRRASSLALALSLASLAVGGACDCARGRPLSMDCIDVAGKRVCRTALTPSLGGDGVDDVNTFLKGRGDSYACRPEKAVDLKHGLLVHLVGTGDDPSVDDGFAERACAAGFAAVAPMYENRKASREVCPDSTDPDACFDAYHREILFGEASDLDGEVDVDEKNSVVSRTQDFLDALAKDDADFAPWDGAAKSFADGDLTTTTLSGHSQGNGHALYWAHEQEAARLVLLSGVADHVDQDGGATAPPTWIADYQGESATDPARFFSLVHQDEDALTSLVVAGDNAAAYGITPLECLWPASPMPAGCHRVVVRPMKCGPVNAHISVVVRTWGDKCQPGVEGHDNGPTWESVLTAAP